MKGKINVNLILNVNQFTQEKSVKMVAKLKILNPAFEGSEYGEMELKPKHQITYPTAQYLLFGEGKKFDLREKCPLVELRNRDCEFIKGKKKDGSEFYAVLVNLAKPGKEEMIRIFYLRYMDIKSVKEYGTLYEFTEDERNVDNLDTDDVDTQDSE